MLAALPASRRRLLTTPGTTIVLTVPNADWVDAFRTYLNVSLNGETTDTDADLLDIEAAAVVIGRNQFWEPWPEFEDSLALAEEAGRMVIAISHDPARCLPRQLVAVAHQIAVPALTEVGVRRLVRQATGQTVRARVSGDLGGRLTPEIIAQAFRNQAGSRACLETLMRLTAAALAQLCDDGQLEPELHQPAGPAAAWAKQAGARVLGWQDYPLAKPRLEAALLVGPADQTRLIAVALATATRAEMATVLPGDHKALLNVAERVRSRSGGMRCGARLLLVYLDAVEFWGDSTSSEGTVLSGLLADALSGAATVVVGATDSLGGLDADMRRLWGSVRPMQGRPGVKLPLHPDIGSGH